MRTRREWFPWTVLCALILIPAGSQAADPEPWELEAGLLAGYHSNFFFRGNEPAPEDNLLWAYFQGEKEVRAGKGKWAFEFGVDAFQNQDIGEADHVGLRLETGYKRGPTRATAELVHKPSQVFSEDGDGTFFDQSGVELEVRHSLRYGLWVGGSVEYEQWDFDAQQDGRDSDGIGVSLSLRYPIGERYGVRGTVLYEDRNADVARFDRSAPGFSIALEGQPSDRMQIFARYKLRDREYDGATAGDRNFGREDTIQDLVLNFRYRIGEKWGVRNDNFYRDGESTRVDRNYDGYRIYVGAFLEF